MLVASVPPTPIYIIKTAPSLPYVQSANFILRLLVIFFTAPLHNGIPSGPMPLKISNHHSSLRTHVRLLHHFSSPMFTIVALRQCPLLLLLPLYFLWQLLKMLSSKSHGGQLTVQDKSKRIIRGLRIHRWLCSNTKKTQT